MSAKSTNLPGSKDYDCHHIDVRWWSWDEALEECWRVGLRIRDSDFAVPRSPRQERV